ncbi:MAG TPA: thiamine-phosphate kinase [Hyphomonadaceae bacterium]|nr:thiamine-phosphate kinase [Hyphomonadaceae bacterium]
MDEFDLIKSYFAPLVTSAGADALRDDVAEIAPGLIATKDAIVEGVHFLPDDPIGTVAQKLVRVNVSDIIAKGGRPDAALLALVWPKGRDKAEIAEFARMLGNDLAKWGAHLVGGDTTSTDGPLMLTLTLLGRVDKLGPVRRSGAWVGDDVWVTGTIGDGVLGLMAAQGKFGKLSAEASNLLVSRYRVPEPPKLAFADVVAGHATGSIDVSDGLVADVWHIAEASGVRIVIRAGDVPLSAVAQSYVTNGKVTLAALLTGGDDYQTLFTAPPTARAELEAARATRIGVIEAGSGVVVLDPSGAEMVFERGGWTHFDGLSQA